MRWILVPATLFFALLAGFSASAQTVEPVASVAWDVPESVLLEPGEKAFPVRAQGSLSCTSVQPPGPMTIHAAAGTGHVGPNGTTYWVLEPTMWDVEWEPTADPLEWTFSLDETVTLSSEAVPPGPGEKRVHWRVMFSDSGCSPFGYQVEESPAQGPLIAWGEMGPEETQATSVPFLFIIAMVALLARRRS